MQPSYRTHAQPDTHPIALCGVQPDAGPYTHADTNTNAHEGALVRSRATVRGCQRRRCAQGMGGVSEHA